MKTKNLPLALLMVVALLLPAWAFDKETTETAPTSTMAVHGRLSPEILVSQAPSMPLADRYKAAVAANFVRGEFLVVWHNKQPSGVRDIYARRVAKDGRLLSWFAISTGAKDRLQPAVAYNASNAEYLVVWMFDVSGNGTQYEIWGKIVAWDGSYQKPEFKIISWPGRSMWTPRVVWNNNQNQYLVVWTAFDTTSLQATDVSTMLLDNKGNLLQGSVLTTSTLPHQVDVAYGWARDEYLLVFVQSHTQATTGNDIYALRVSAGNAVVMPPGLIEIYAGAEHQNAPRVAADAKGGYMVVWQHEYEPGDNDIYAQEMSGVGKPIGGILPIATGKNDERAPAITTSFHSKPQCFLVWERAVPNGSTLAGRQWGEGLKPELFTLPEAAFWETVEPAVAWSPPYCVVAYAGDSTSDPTVTSQIYAHTWAPSAAWLPLILR